MGRLELLPDKYKYHVHFGQRVPESVLKELKQGSEELACDGSGDAGDDITSSKVCRKRKRDSGDRDGPLDDDEDDDRLLKVTPPKKSKLDNSNTATLRSNDSSKPQQTSLTTFYKPKSSTSNDVDANVAPLEPKWEEKGSLLILRFGEPIHSSKIASYDLDGTLIETASGRKFATSASDWKLKAKVTGKLQSMHREGYKIVIISNQLGISKGKPPVGEYKQKVESIAQALKLPLLLLAATSKDKYRKPGVGMWDHLTGLKNGGVTVDLKKSFYVGDAAGREANWRPGKYMYMHGLCTCTYTVGACLNYHIRQNC